MSQIASQVSLTMIGEYEIVEKIGKGGQGTVYKAQHPVTGEIVAIKVIPAEVIADEVQRLRFAQECQVTRQLEHPNIVRVLDFGMDGTKPYLVMELVDGEDLGQRVDRDGRVPEGEAVDVIVQVGRALHWAHERKLIHRDVKPDNILMTSDGQAKLADLGLAKNLEGDFNLTQTLSCLGTPNFMAPEQFEDAKRVDCLSDVYALAATLYMVVTGELPFRARSQQAVGAIYKKKLANDIAAPRKLVPEISERVEGAILKALRAKRSERFASMSEFLEALTGEPFVVAVRPSGGASRKNNGKAASKAAERKSNAKQAGLSPDRKSVSKHPSSVAGDRLSLDGDGSERRIMKRYPSKRGTSCHPIERAVAAPWAGQVVNISQTGLCLELSRRFEPGALLTVVLESEHTKRRSLVVRVMWTKKISSNCWQMGCQHDNPLCDFEVTELA